MGNKDRKGRAFHTKLSHAFDGGVVAGGDSGLDWSGDGTLGKRSELRFVPEIEPTGPEAELDGDEGKEGSRMTPGIGPTDIHTLRHVRTAVESRLFIHQMFAMGKLGRRGSGRLAK